MKLRNLDSVYFRIKRNNKWMTVCFSDLTDEEKEKMGDGKTLEWWKKLALIEAKELRGIGDEFDITGE